MNVTATCFMETVLNPAKQYMNPPMKPDYSKETIDKIFELGSLDPNSWIGSSQMNV